MRIKVRAVHAAWLLGGATLAISGAASAQTVPACSSLGNVVYTSGSSAFKPVLQAVANVLGNSVTIVYQSPGSCEGLEHVLEVTPDTDSPIYFVPNGATGTCSLPTAGANVDIGFSDVYPATCTAAYDQNLPAITSGQTGDFQGPVQAMTFAVPTNSTATNISAEAAYMVFGFDAASGKTISPWVTPTDVYVRYYDSGTLEMIGTAINLVGSKWVNATNKSSTQTASGTGGMVTDLTTSGGMSGHVSSTIGIVSTSGLTTGIKGLAFQGTGQSCSYYPDSTSSTHDKINVRQGRYEIWGPEHIVTNVNANNKPVGVNGNNAAVQTLVNALTSTSQALATESDAGAGDGGVTSLGETEVGQLITAMSAPATGFIPTCAMQVSRTTEIGPESSYAPPAACSCAFQYAAGAPITGCTACTEGPSGNAGTVCTGSTPACHFGYCEAE